MRQSTVGLCCTKRHFLKTSTSPESSPWANRSCLYDNNHVYGAELGQYVPVIGSMATATMTVTTSVI